MRRLLLGLVFTEGEVCAAGECSRGRQINGGAFDPQCFTASAPGGGDLLLVDATGAVVLRGCESIASDR